MWYRLFLILLLPLIAGVIIWDGLQYNPEEIQFKSSESAGPSEVMDRLPTSISQRNLNSPPRQYNKDNLYEYVNGHAEFFISAGFRYLVAADYLADGTDPAFVADFYHMGNAANAFGTLMEEKSQGAQSVTIGFQGYASHDLLLFVRGPYYIKVGLFEKGLDIQNIGKQIDETFQGLTTEIPQFELLPKKNGIPGSESFIKEDFLGHAFLKDVYLREYEENGKGYRAFVCVIQAEGSPANWEQLLRFYRDQGVEPEELQESGKKYYVLQDPFEGKLLLFPSDGYLFGFQGEWEGVMGVSRLLGTVE